jgi:hypothetical protein
MLQDDTTNVDLNETASVDEEGDTAAIDLGPKYEANYPAPIMTKR